jgi:phage terminase large subunit-like protein
MAATQTMEFVASGLEYARSVVAGDVVACKWVKLACQRHLDDLERFTGEDSPFYFDDDAANRVCDIVERFPHIKGVWAQARKKLELEPWQTFILIVVFGWMCTATGTRRFRVAYIEVARKNAKSTITSAVGNYLTACDGEHGALVVSAAATQKQATLLFADAQAMCRKEPGFLQRFGVEVLAHVITQPGTASKFEPVSSEYSNLDGLNLHGALVDELHAHPSRGLWDVLETATGSRAQPLLWAITTAGLNRASVCYDQHQHTIDILSKRLVDESYFGIIFTLDEGDDPFDEEVWPKANPNYGVSIYPESMRATAKRAQQMPSALNAWLTKHCNVWVNADTAWLPSGAWDRCVDLGLTLDDFAGQPCYIGIDLAFRNDIAAIVFAFPPVKGRDWWAVFGKHYLPEDTVQRSENTHLQGWESTGDLVATPGVVTDFSYIVNDLADFTARFNAIEIALDPAGTGPLHALLDNAGIKTPRVEVRQSAANMTPGMIELEGLVLGKKIRHDGDPVLAWMFSNVVAHRSDGGNMVQPRKETDDRKIDGVVALIMCISRSIKTPAPYEGQILWV